MHVEELKNEREWETFLEGSPSRTFYHGLKWKEVIQRSFHHYGLYLIIKDENGRIVGICPGFITGSMRSKVYDSMPHSDYGGPVIERQRIKEASLSLQSFLQDFCSNKGIVYVKFCFTDDKLGRFFRSQSGWIETIRGVVELDLKATPSDFIWNKTFSKKRRKDIRLVERRGFQAQEARTKSDLRDFYNLYYKNMRYIGASPYPYSFIENMWSVLYPGNLHIWLLEKNRAVGGILLFKDDRKSYCVYAGLDKTQRVDIVNYLIWKEIKKAEEEGRRYVSLGSTPSDPRNPYFVQKMRFGGSFYPQQMIWYPIGYTWRFLLQTRAKTLLAWKIFKRLLPVGFQRISEIRFSRF